MRGRATSDKEIGRDGMAKVEWSSMTLADLARGLDLAGDADRLEWPCECVAGDLIPVGLGLFLGVPASPTVPFIVLPPPTAMNDA